MFRRQYVLMAGFVIVAAVLGVLEWLGVIDVWPDEG